MSYLRNDVSTDWRSQQMGRATGIIIESPRYLRKIEQEAESTSQRQRIHALRLMREEGLSMRAIADRLGVSERQVRRWWGRYRSDGLQGLLADRRRGGRRPKSLDAATRDLLRQKVRSNELSTLKQTQEWLEREAGVSYSLASVHRLLKREIAAAEDHATVRSVGVRAAGVRTNTISPSAIPDPVVRFLNSMPITGNTVEWINTFRETLRLVLPDVDRVSLSINRQANLSSNHSTEMVFQVTQHTSSEGALKVVSVDTHDSASTQRYSDALLQSSRNQGFPFEQYHPPHAIDYFYGGVAYVGTLFLWRSIDQPPISPSSIELIERLEPFMIYAITAHIAWFQSSRPTDRGFQSALHDMVRATNLSRQEQRIVVLQLLGNSYKDIADLLSVKVVTVKKHIKSIYMKTETRSLSELFAKYFTSRILTPGGEQGH